MELKFHRRGPAPAGHRRPLALQPAGAALGRLPGDVLGRPVATLSIDADDLVRLIDKTRFAISTEETRYYLNGLYLHTVSEEGRPCCARSPPTATGWPWPRCPPEGAAGLPGVIVPRKTIAEARRLLDDAGETVSCRSRRPRCGSSSGRGALTSKVIDGSFPDYVRVIPQGQPQARELDAKLFANAVDRVATISAEKCRSVKLAIEPGKLTLTVRNMEAGQAVEELEIDYDGDSFEIGFNARYLLDVCGQISGEIMELRFADPSSPTLVIDPSDAGVQYVLMPLRV